MSIDVSTTALEYDDLASLLTAEGWKAVYDDGFSETWAKGDDTFLVTLPNVEVYESLEISLDFRPDADFIARFRLC